MLSERGNDTDNTMNDTQNISAEDIALIRHAEAAAAGSGGRKSRTSDGGAVSRASSDSRSGATRTRKSRSSTSGSKKSGPDKTPNVDPDERLRQVLGVLLGLGGLLLFLALISYSRLDQANTDVQPTELVGLLTNDPDIAARADTTINWLGLLGAFFADFFLNGTIGWFALAMPVLLGYWSLIVFTGRDVSRATRSTLFTLLIATLSAAILGTIRGISWMPEIAHEWSGAVGAFLASVLTGLTGSAGSLLLLLAGTAIAVVYAFDADLRTVAVALGGPDGILRKGYEKVSGGLSTLKSTIEVERSGDEPRRARAGRKKSGASDEPDAQSGAGARLDEEPARMMRRIDAADDIDDISVPMPEQPQRNAPTINRLAQLAGKGADIAKRRNESAQQRPVTGGDTEEPLREERPSVADYRTKAEPPPSPAGTEQPATAAATAPGSAPIRNQDVQAQGAPAPAASENAAAGSAQVAPETSTVDTTRQPTEPERQNPDLGSVTLSRRPLEEPNGPGDGPKLTVHVEDAETDEDLETEDAGQLIERLRDEQIKYNPPPIELLLAQEAHEEVEDQELKTNARLLQEKLRTFNIEIEDLTVTPGPVVTLFEFVPAAGIKLSQIESLGDDIALALKARGIRIIAPIPGKGTVGVEIPNNNPAMVRIRSVLNTVKFREADMQLPLALGKTTVGEVFCADLSKMPHLLIAGATGAGKSVGINSILASLVYKMHPSNLKLAIIDPKKIELTQYRALVDHFLVSCPDIDEDIVTDPQNAVILLKSLELEMDRRYDMLAKSGQRNLVDYNRKIDEGALKPTPDAPHVKLPFIVLIIDELADLMITAAKEVEEPIARLAQLARAIGIHMIVATQRPSVDVLTGMIKANFPARIAYQVATKIDSRTILDMNGAEQLLGNGDMLYLPGGRPKPLRLQNAFISTDEVEDITQHIGNQRGYTNPYPLPSVAEKKKQAAVSSIDERDELFDEAAHLVVRHQQGSVSLIQRRMKVGYARAARIIDELEDAGIVGSFDGSKARAVLLESEAELEAFL